MEAIASLPSANPLQGTLEAFQLLLAAKKDSIFEIPKKTFKYGATDRHQLDIYYPLQNSGGGRTPILYFCYPGHFIAGERNQSPVTWYNVGAFFARRGYIVVIPDYRLVPHVTYPGAAEDVRDAIRWAIQNPNELVSEGSPFPDTNAIILAGQTAGAFHVGTLLFNTHVIAENDELRSKIVAAVLVEPAYENTPILALPFVGMILPYFGGSNDNMVENGLVLHYGRLSDSAVKKLPKILMVEAQDEPELITTTGKMFIEAVKERTGVDQKKVVGVGHNHFSLSLALSSGEGEEWAEEVVEWLKE